MSHLEDTPLGAGRAQSGSADGAPTFMEISNTLRLRYRKSGSGPALVLLHTIRTQIEYFRALSPLLEKHYTVHAIDLPGHGYSDVDQFAALDEPFMRKAVIDFITKLDLTDITMVGESIGATLSLTVAASLPDRVKRVFALNTYDYETRYGDGIRRGNAIANFIVGSLQIPYIGAFNASLENKLVLGMVMGGGYFNSRKLPPDLLTEFDRVAHRPGYKRSARKVLAGWRSWKAAQVLYSKISAPVTLIYGSADWSRAAERDLTKSLISDARVFTLQQTGHFSSVENPKAVAGIILTT